MDECKMEQLFELVDYLRCISARPCDESSSFSRAFSYGRASAYSLCADWLEEILL